MHTQTHTAIPWHVAEVKSYNPDYPNTLGILAEDQTILFRADNWLEHCQAEADANAAFIVRACNAHDELVAALQDLLAATAANYLPGIPELEDAQHTAQAALSKAQEGEV